MLKNGKYLKAAEGRVGKRSQNFYSSEPKVFGGIQISQDGAKFEQCGGGTENTLIRRERSESDGRIRDQAEFDKTRWGLIKRRQDADDKSWQTFI